MLDVPKTFPGQDLAASVKLPPFFGARKGENVQDWLRAIEAYIYTHPQTNGYVLLYSLAQGEVAKCVNSLIIRKSDRLHEPACWDECIMEIQMRFCGRAKFRSPIPSKRCYVTDHYTSINTQYSLAICYLIVY